jgi:hypothetical protein
VSSAAAMSASHLFPIEEYIGCSFFYSRVSGQKSGSERARSDHEFRYAPGPNLSAPLHTSRLSLSAFTRRDGFGVYKRLYLCFSLRPMVELRRNNSLIMHFGSIWYLFHSFQINPWPGFKLRVDIRCGGARCFAYLEDTIWQLNRYRNQDYQNSKRSNNVQLINSSLPVLTPYRKDISHTRTNAAPVLSAHCGGRRILS